MICRSRLACGGIAALALLAATAAQAQPASQVAPQADFVFDTLGPAACEMPPPGFDISQFRTFVETKPDAPVTKGEISGGLAAGFAGGGLYGTDAGGGLVVGVQGMVFDDAPALTMLCMVLVRLGDSDATSGAIVGEAGMADAPDGAFLGVFKLVQRNDADVPVTLATGTVDGGSVSFDLRDGLLVDGSVTVEGSYRQLPTDEAVPFSARIAIPRAENVLRPALRLARD